MSRPAPLPPAGFSVDSMPPRESIALDPQVEQGVREVLVRHLGRPGALLPILHDVQEMLHCVPDTVVPMIAEALQLSRAEVHGVITFYPHFRRAPGARHHIEVCRAESCQAMGANELLAHASQRLGCGLQQSSQDGRYELQAVYCLGLCAQSPAIMIDGQPWARVTRERFDALIQNLPEVST